MSSGPGAVHGRVGGPRSGYHAGMSEPEHEPTPGRQPSDADRDLAEHERPDVGLISDEELPEDLRPSDDNPLAKDPDDSDGKDSGGPAPSPDRVEGMPDMGNPGAPG